MPTLIGAVAKRFIAQPEFYAVQRSAWYPSRAYNPETEKYDGPLQPLTADLIKAHLDGTKTLGHYMVNRDNDTKLFAFDLDLVDHDAPFITYPSAESVAKIDENFADDPERRDAAYEHLLKIGRQSGNPRELWQDKQHPSRPYYLRQMRGLAEMLSSRIHTELGIPVACEYSGFKGLHVYGFTGMIPAGEARALAVEILESFSRFEKTRGENFWADNALADPDSGFPTLEIEVFPKQDTVSADGFGNLMALPLGRNQKAPKTKKFFLDQRAPHATIKPHPDPLALLTSGNPWED